MPELLPPEQWKKLEELFLAALDRPAAERAGFVAAECGPDVHLRNEALSLLQHDEDAPADEEALMESVRLSAASAVDDCLPGRMLGPYRVERELGRGGTGAVFVAAREDLPLSKPVAIKLVKRGMDTAEVLARFRHERQILAGLEHPFIARFMDAGSSPDGRPFLVMELVEGKPVDEYCAEHNCSVEERCRLFLKVCEAVSYAHRKLVVHRDLKPRNILIASDGAPKLLDFGLAKILDQERRSRVTTTRGSRPFTPEYASPEQVRGLTLNTATDIYSLGAILYELLAGVRSHRLDGSSPGSWEREICDREPPRPSLAAGNSRLRRKLEGDLDNVVMMAMRKEPDRRYRSVDEFAADIQRYLELRPVAAREDSLWYRTAKFIRRRRLPLLAAAAVVSSVGTGVVLAITQGRAAERARLHAEDRLTQVAILSDRSLSDVYAMMERLPGSIPARKTMIATTLDILEKLSREAGGNLRLRAALARAFLRLGDLQGDPDAANMGDKEGSLKSYRAGLALLESPDQPMLPLRAGHDALLVWINLRHKTGSLLRESGQLPAARQLLQETIAVVEKLPSGEAGRSDTGRQKGLLYITLARTMRPDFAKARAFAASAIETFDQLVAREPANADLPYNLSMAHTEMGYVLLFLGEREESAKHYEQCMRLRERLVSEHPGDAVFRRSLLLVYEHYSTLMSRKRWPGLDRPEQARLYAEKALAIAEADAGDPDNRVAAADFAETLLDVAVLDVPRAGLPDSLAKLRKAAQIYESLRPSDVHCDGLLSFTYLYIAKRLEAMGRPGEAAAEYNRAASMAARALHESVVDPDAALVQAETGQDLLRVAGSSAGAAKSIEQPLP